MDARFLQVTTAIDSGEGAERIASRLVEDRAAACVQILGPISSTYWWNGGMERSREWLCVIKTTAVRFPEVRATIEALHPYDVPEITAVPIVAGNEAYLDWIGSEVREAT